MVSNRYPHKSHHRITECLGLAGTSVGHPAQLSCRSRVTQSWLHRTLSRQVLNISREGDSTAPLGSLCQGSVTLRVKKFFLVFRRNFPCSSLCPLPLVLSLGTTGKSLAKPRAVYAPKMIKSFGKLHLIKLFILEWLKHTKKRLSHQETFMKYHLPEHAEGNFEC